MSPIHLRFTDRRVVVGQGHLRRLGQHQAGFADVGLRGVRLRRRRVSSQRRLPLQGISATPRPSSRRCLPAPLLPDTARNRTSGRPGRSPADIVPRPAPRRRGGLQGRITQLDFRRQRFRGNFALAGKWVAAVAGPQRRGLFDGTGGNRFLRGRAARGTLRANRAGPAARERTRQVGGLADAAFSVDCNFSHNRISVLILNPAETSDRHIGSQRKPDANYFWPPTQPAITP